MATIQMTLDDYLAAEAEDVAKSLGTTLSGFVAEALRQAVLRHRYADDEIDEDTWSRSIATNPAFADLFDAEVVSPREMTRRGQRIAHSGNPADATTRSACPR